MNCARAGAGRSSRSAVVLVNHPRRQPAAVSPRRSTEYWSRALPQESGAGLKAPEIMTGLLKMDNQLFEFWRTREDQGDAAPGGWLAKAKNIMAKRLMKLCPRESTPRKDSLRRAVERHMASLGLSGNPRKKAEPDPAECTKKERPGADIVAAKTWRAINLWRRGGSIATLLADPGCVNAP